MKSTRGFESIIAMVFGAWVLLAICLQTWGVLSRNVLNWSTAWLDDLQRFNFIWLIWILAAIAYGTRGLIKLDLLQSALVARPRAYHVVSLGIALIELVFGVGLLVLGARILSTHIASGETTVSIGAPVWVLTAGFVIGCALISLFALKNSITALRRLVAGGPVNHESEIAQEVEDALEGDVPEQDAGYDTTDERGTR